LVGELRPAEGTLRHGTNLEIAYFDQLKRALDDEKTVQKNVSDYEAISINGRERHVLGYLQDFLFSPERARSLVKFLSGGERSRLLLAKLFTRPSNVLVLDEPTNDLDIETLELLESLLVEYQGTVLLVSHDRAFLNDVATSTLVIETGGRVKEYDGGYDDYLRQRPAEVPTGRESTGAASKAKPLSSAREQPRKLSFKERKELEELPGRIEGLESAVRELHEAMADPSFYQQGRGEIAQAMSRLEGLERDLAAAYARWQVLEEIAS
jgi:ABC transport system ATP-binding/permease protein